MASCDPRLNTKVVRSLKAFAFQPTRSTPPQSGPVMMTGPLTFFGILLSFRETPALGVRPQAAGHGSTSGLGEPVGAEPTCRQVRGAVR